MATKNVHHLPHIEKQMREQAELARKKGAQYLASVSAEQAKEVASKTSVHATRTSELAAKAAKARKLKIGGGVAAGAIATATGAHYLYKRKKRRDVSSQ